MFQMKKKKNILTKMMAMILMMMMLFNAIFFSVFYVKVTVVSAKTDKIAPFLIP